jgi:hypothetical protein
MTLMTVLGFPPKFGGGPTMSDDQHAAGWSQAPVSADRPTSVGSVFAVDISDYAVASRRVS